MSQGWQARLRGALFFLHYFHLDSSEVVQLVHLFNLSSKYYNSMENITGKRSDPVRKIINIAQKRASTVIRNCVK